MREKLPVESGRICHLFRIGEQDSGYFGGVHRGAATDGYHAVRTELLEELAADLH